MYEASEWTPYVIFGFVSRLQTLFSHSAHGLVGGSFACFHVGCVCVCRCPLLWIVGLKKPLS